MTKVENLEAPKGWLIDPHNKWAIHFDCKMGSGENKGLDFTIDMWGLDANGKPLNFKSRRKATKQDSLQTWMQLVSSKWEKFFFDIEDPLFEFFKKKFQKKISKKNFKKKFQKKKSKKNFSKNF